MSSVSSTDSEDRDPSQSPRKTVNFATAGEPPADRRAAPAGQKSAMRQERETETDTQKQRRGQGPGEPALSQVPPLSFDFDKSHRGPEERVSHASTDTQRDVVEGSRPSIGAGLTLELIQQTDAPPTPRTDGAMLMTGTPRTPRGSIPYETELLREQLEEQLAMTVALREQLEASSVEAAVKQLRENWLLAEDRADQHRARLTDVCLQQVPSLKRELAALSGENTVLRTQVAELMDDLQEATLLGHELVMVTPRQQDFDSMQSQIEEQLAAAKQAQGHSATQLQQKDNELRALRAELAKGDEEREELRARVTQVCAQRLPELKQQLAERDRAIEALEAENEELRTRATRLVTVYVPDLKNEISAREQEKNALRDQMGELQAKADQRTILQAQVDSFSSDKSRLEEEMMSLKSELAEVTMQAAQLRGEAARHDIARSVHATEMERLRMALEAAGNNNVRQAEKWKQKATGLTKEHVHAMDTRSKVVADEVAKLTVQWQKDAAARDLRMQEMQSTASDLQKKLVEANARSAHAEATAQEDAAEFEMKLAELKSAQRIETAKLETSLEESVRARQHLEERVATVEADAGLLRSSLQETRRQLDVASQQRVHRESAFELRRQEFDARSASDSRRCAALERRVEALQQELLKLSDSVADGNASGGSAAIRTSQQLSWYSEQLQTSQQTARRLQSEVDHLSRENFQLTEQSSFAREQLAKSARSTSMAFDNSPPRTGSGGGGRPGASNLTVASEQLSESIIDLQHSRQLASARASELGRLQMQKNLTPAEVVAQRRAAEVADSRASHLELWREYREHRERLYPSRSQPDTYTEPVSPRGEVASLSKQRTASVIAASQLRAELSSCRVQAKEAKANGYSTAVACSGSRNATSTSGGAHGDGTSNRELQHGPPTSSTSHVLQSQPVESVGASESASSGLGSLPSGTPARPRFADSPIASAGRKSQQKDASPAEPQAIQDPTTKQPGEKWSHYYARRAAGD